MLRICISNKFPGDVHLPAITCDTLKEKFVMGPLGHWHFQTLCDSDIQQSPKATALCPALPKTNLWEEKGPGPFSVLLLVILPALDASPQSLERKNPHFTDILRSATNMMLTLNFY